MRSNIAKYLLLVAIVLTAEEFVLLGNSAMDEGLFDYARLCYQRAEVMEIIK